MNTIKKGGGEIEYQLQDLHQGAPAARTEVAPCLPVLPYLPSRTAYLSAV